MNWKIKYAILGLAFWLLLFLGWEWWRSYPKVRPVPVVHPESLEGKIDSVLLRALGDLLIPGLAVGVVEDQKVIYLKAFGYLDLETKDSLSVQSQLPVASVSKLFTALGLAKLGLESGFPVDTTLNALLPRGKQLPREFDGISLRDLLRHASGLSDSRSIRNLLLGEEKRKLNLLPEYLPTPDLDNKGYQYADINFDLLGYAMESKAKKPFEELIRESTLKAAGMETSHFPSARPLGPAQGYKRTFLWKRLQATDLKLERYPSPSSGLLVSPEELSKALLHLCRGNMGAFDKELGWLQGKSDLPAGFQKITLNGSVFLGHFGEQGGFSAILAYSPELELGLFLLANAEDKADFRKLLSSEILTLLSSDHSQ
ncbi:beta-lactamase family protein [Algoriphagus sp. H41]|uniref:Beta-lactamase family protein n=1 Tax=Algoriphagus oliviformis TaxID=2811231 RepID=A0ABS3C934_9BACT|nr:serine hydrolase domain-containing protein [Algoriphagus oliviformis]MBN7813612.1 beta-lactamase family protein [Algoriphagus oliviformis]